METEGVLDDVKVSDVVMHDVTTPLHLSIKPGNTAGRISVDHMTATGVNLAAASLESWAKAPIERVSLRDVSLEFTGGGAVDPAHTDVRAPGVDARPLPAWGLYARNVHSLQLENVRLGVVKDDTRPALIAEHIGTLDLDSLKLPRGAPAPLVLKDVGDVRSSAMNVALVPASCVDLSVTATLPAAVATLQGGEQDGLARVDLIVDGDTQTQWVWLQARELKSVAFTRLSLAGAGPHHLRCGGSVCELPAGKP